jgi:hypothetical protein
MDGYVLAHGIGVDKIKRHRPDLSKEEQLDAPSKLDAYMVRSAGAAE